MCAQNKEDPNPRCEENVELVVSVMKIRIYYMERRREREQRTH